jgi:OOP family OmpA-OmpF porin
VPAGEVILHFAIDRSEITPSGREALEAWITQVKGVGVPVRISVSGYADATGRFRHNLPLSGARAKAVAQILQTEGVQVASVHGFGSLRPVATNRTPEGRARNRRVDIRLNAPAVHAQGVVDSGLVWSRQAAHAMPSISKTRLAR